MKKQAIFTQIANDDAKKAQSQFSIGNKVKTDNPFGGFNYGVVVELDCDSQVSGFSCNVKVKWEQTDSFCEIGSETLVLASNLQRM